jgi:hypothetical protein
VRARHRRASLEHEGLAQGRRRVCKSNGVAVKALLLLGLLVSVADCARRSATDFSGQWTFTMNPDPRGNLATVECALRQDGQKLVVKCGNGTSEMTGAVDGRMVSFRTPSAETKKGYIVSFDGEVNVRTMTLEGTWRAAFALPSSPEVRTGKFSATRR